MASIKALVKVILNVKHIVIEDVDTDVNVKNEPVIRIGLHPAKGYDCICPKCGKKCKSYDFQSKKPRKWRDLDWGGTLVELYYRTKRVKCPEHGVIVADVPWAFPGSDFTKRFDLMVAWQARELSKTAITKLMRIEWHTVERCIDRALNAIEPDRSIRLENLTNAGVDETSFRKGYKYLTVVLDNDTNNVAWVEIGHGKSVLEEFFKALSPVQRAKIKTVTGDGARWITDCSNEYLPNYARCIDNYHVVDWANKAVDQVRLDSMHTARDLIKEGAKMRKSKDEKEAEKGEAMEAVGDELKKLCKGSTYALGKNPENLTKQQKLKLEMITNKSQAIYKAYQLKEDLRLLLKMYDPVEAEKALDGWLYHASHSQLEPFKELYEKIKRNKEFILNSIRFKLNNARVEAVNNKIKLIIRKAYGFRNLDNLKSMIYLICSDLEVPLPHQFAALLTPA